MDALICSCIGVITKKLYGQYKHNGFENSADAQVRRTIVGRSSIMNWMGREKQALIKNIDELGFRWF